MEEALISQLDLLVVILTLNNLLEDLVYLLVVIKVVQVVLVEGIHHPAKVVHPNNQDILLSLVTQHNQDILHNQDTQPNQDTQLSLVIRRNLDTQPSQDTQPNQDTLPNLDILPRAGTVDSPNSKLTQELV